MAGSLHPIVQPSRPKALDLFCCAGGAGMGISQAGYDVTGVDIEPQPEYPHRFLLGNALDADLSGYDFVWASPPCQCFTKYKNCRPNLADKYQDLIAATRAKLTAWGGVWIMENVVGAPLVNPITLCGSMFGLDVRRHRLFESNVPLQQPSCNHSIWKPNRFPGGRSRERGHARILCRGTMEIGRWNIPLAAQKTAMGMEWVTDLRKLSEAIPPVYAEYLARQIMRVTARLNRQGERRARQRRSESETKQ
jgi:DNA (cytosine-5)-methyltransferase 1